jgi:acid stress-induced BolA-like protein IbaG/YrbA
LIIVTLQNDNRRCCIESNPHDLKERVIIVIQNAGYTIDLDGLEVLSSGNIGGFISSPQFEGVSDLERQNKIWKALEDGLRKDDLIKISGIMAMTPQEVKELD